MVVRVNVYLRAVVMGLVMHHFSKRHRGKMATVSFGVVPSNMCLSA